jgi:hypothetical protein
MLPQFFEPCYLILSYALFAVLISGGKKSPAKVMHAHKEEKLRV